MLGAQTANVSGILPKHMHGNARAQLQNIWLTETREHAQKACDTFLTIHDTKYPKASECLRKGRVTLIAFYDFPAGHWQHIRTTNPIESTFATVCLRTAKTRNCVSRMTILAMVFKLSDSEQKRWRRLRGAPPLKR